MILNSQLLLFKQSYLQCRYDFDTNQDVFIFADGAIAYIAAIVSSESILIKANSETGAPISIYYLTKTMYDMYFILQGSDFIVGFYQSTENRIKA